jgi:hypothetical protein
MRTTRELERDVFHGVNTWQTAVLDTGRAVAGRLEASSERRGAFHHRT